MQENSGTRSALLFEVKRLLNECTELPDVLVMENVPQVHSEKNKADFDLWLEFLKNKGYINFYTDLNAKNFGVPQNRERCFCISVLSDEFVEYEFPKEIKLPYVMKDYLEPVVDEKYYINSPKAKELIEKLIVENKIKEETTVDLCLKNPKQIEVANCIKARVDAGISNLQSDGSITPEPSKNGGGQTIFMKNMIDKNKDVDPSGDNTDPATPIDDSSSDTSSTDNSTDESNTDTAQPVVLDDPENI
jgi:DNA (cytosine-5)-methyltransferase 1